MAAFVTLVGTAWYGLLYALTGFVYAPLGVEPRELGLGSGAVLAQATVSLVILPLLLFISFLAVMVIALLFPNKEMPGPVEARMYEGIPVATVFALPFSLFLGLAISCTIAWSARSSLEDGKSPGLPLDLPPPWSADIVSPRWVGGLPVVDLPTCALYLGQSDGTAVLYDSNSKQALRVPASDLILGLGPRLDQCD